ncbi:MAG: hypothetical protein PUG43_03085 [Clostridiales bacterium]|nr:hypothetical protein [Clostridiales bacterium]MDD7347495.1 hypothetical protein [Clostridiales bacterium]MDY4061241.1 hypothetical protein [Anaerovoracaceae bacterium]
MSADDNELWKKAKRYIIDRDVKEGNNLAKNLLCLAAALEILAGIIMGVSTKEPIIASLFIASGATFLITGIFYANEEEKK